MKQIDAEAGGRKSFPWWANRLASASAAAAVLLLMGAGAKADVLATFTLSGSLGTLVGPKVPFTGTIQLDIDNDFVHDTVQSFQIFVQGRPVFGQGGSVNLAMSNNGVIGASNGADVLSLTFATPNPGTWNGFGDGSTVNDGSIVNGEVIFGGLSGILLGANGVITSNHPIIERSVPDPPSETAPEPSTWTMMLVGLAGLGLAAKRRRALAFPGGQA
jgi:hypothetical protein